MKIKDLTQDELESMSYVEITELILTEKKDKLKIVDIFKEICKLLHMSDADFENRIADYFELVSTDKNFILLDKGYLDLRKKHAPKVIIEEDEEEEIIDSDALEDNAEEEEKIDSDEDIFYDNSSEEDDVDDDDDELSDFVIEDEEETGM